MAENKNKKTVTDSQNNVKKFPCNRPKHKKGKVPTPNELDYRRTRDGD